MFTCNALHWLLQCLTCTYRLPHWLLQCLTLHTGAHIDCYNAFLHLYLQAPTLTVATHFYNYIYRLPYCSSAILHVHTGPPLTCSAMGCRLVHVFNSVRSVNLVIGGGRRMSPRTCSHPVDGVSDECPVWRPVVLLNLGGWCAVGAALCSQPHQPAPAVFVLTRRNMVSQPALRPVTHVLVLLLCDFLVTLKICAKDN